MSSSFRTAVVVLVAVSALLTVHATALGRNSASGRLLSRFDGGSSRTPVGAAPARGALGPPAQGVVAAAPAGSPSGPATPVCTPVDRTVQGIPPTINCLEEYVVSPTSTCPAANQKTTVPHEVGLKGCPKHPEYVPKTAKLRSPNCYTIGGPGLTYTDQPVVGSNKPEAGSLTPSQALRNAKPAMDSRLWYSQCRRSNYYRIDCVGLVARAWNLHINVAYTTKSLLTPSNPVNCADMVPGDMLVSDKHTMLFHHWVEKGVTYVAWHARAPTLGHQQSVENLAKHLKNNEYQCRRYKFMNITNPTPPPPPPQAVDPAGGPLPAPGQLPGGAPQPVQAPAGPAVPNPAQSPQQLAVGAVPAQAAAPVTPARAGAAPPPNQLPAAA